MKNRPQKLLSPNFFSVLPSGPKPAQISISVPSKLLTAQLMYNDFVAYSMHLFSALQEPWNSDEMDKTLH